MLGCRFTVYRGPEFRSCVRVYCETGTLSLIHGDTFSVSAAKHECLPLASLDLFVIELSIGDKVFYTRATGLRVTAKVSVLLDDGHVMIRERMRHMCVPCVV